MIKWLLIDIGDVLLLKNKQNNKNFSQLLADELGVDIELAQEVNRAHYSVMDVKYIPEDVFVANLREYFDYDAPSDIFSYFDRAYRKQVTANAELQDFLKEVRASGIKTAVLSNTIAIYRDIQRELGVSIENGLDPILYSWELELAKPNREIYEAALRRLAVAPDEVVFIDDKTEHLEGAQSVGIGTLLFSDTQSVISQIRTIISTNL